LAEPFANGPRSLSIGSLEQTALAWTAHRLDPRRRKSIIEHLFAAEGGSWIWGSSPIVQLIAGGGCWEQRRPMCGSKASIAKESPAGLDLLCDSIGNDCFPTGPWHRARAGGLFLLGVSALPGLPLKFAQVSAPNNGVTVGGQARRYKRRQLRRPRAPYSSCRDIEVDHAGGCGPLGSGMAGVTRGQRPTQAVVGVGLRPAPVRQKIRIETKSQSTIPEKGGKTDFRKKIIDPGCHVLIFG